MPTPAIMAHEIIRPDGPSQGMTADQVSSLIEGAKARTGRSCGDCSLCCKLLEIHELLKPAGNWCQYCKPASAGCTIYEHRPDSCRGFGCLWLVNDHLGPEWYPRTSKMVLSLTGNVLSVFIDPSNPTNWQREPYFLQIKAMALHGLRGDFGHRYRTMVRQLKPTRDILVLPDRELDVSDKAGAIISVGENKWEFMPCESEEDAKEALKIMDATKRKIMEIPEADRHRLHLEVTRIAAAHEIKTADALHDAYVEVMALKFQIALARLKQP